MAVELDHLPDGRLVREKVLLDGLTDQDDVAREFYVFVSQIAAVAERVGIRRQKALVRSGYRQSRRGLQSVVGALALKIETLQADVARDPFHQLLVTNRLGVTDVAAVLVLVRVASTLTAADGILRELENIRAEKT